MTIIIDGYNLLRHRFPKVKGKLDKQRDQLIAQLGLYRAACGHTIIIIFDGGVSGHASRAVRSGVVVMFSGRSRSADELIVDYVRRHAGHEMVLISRDKELIGRVTTLGAESLDLELFDRKLYDRLLEDVVAGHEIDDDTYRCTADGKRGQSPEGLRLLMEQAAFGPYDKDDDYRSPMERRGNPRKASKKDRRKQQLLDKL